MKIRQGLFSFARLKRSRTRLAPTPTNISTNSEPEREKKGTPASPAMAFASRVLPVPGGPTSSTPFGIRAPTDVKRSGCFRKVTTSCRSCLASETPATSSNLTPVSASMAKRALVLPNCIAWPGPPGMPSPRLARKIKDPISRSGNNRFPSSPRAGGAVRGG